jgi:hypothetical protein
MELRNSFASQSAFSSFALRVPTTALYASLEERVRMVLSFKPVSSFIGVDLKLGATLICLLGVLNKVAGVYGILAVFTGGTFAQVSLYVYSVATLLIFLWGLKSIAEVCLSQMPISTVLNAATGTPQSRLELCSCVYAGSFRLDDLYGSVWRDLVGLHAARRSKSRAQCSSEGYPGQRGHAEQSHGSRTSSRCSSRLVFRTRFCIDRHCARLAHQGSSRP